MRVLTCKGRHYGNFSSFKIHWALLACLRWSLGSLGLPWVPFVSHWGSICHLRGSIGAPLGRPWAPFVAFGAPLGRLWASLEVNFGLNFSSSDNLRTFRDVCSLLDYFGRINTQ